MILLSLFLSAVGLCLIIWSKKLAWLGYHKIQLPTAKTLSSLAKHAFEYMPDSESYWMVKMNRVVIIFVGIVFLLAAYTNYFGSL